MECEEIRQQIQIATALVETWPDWKRSIVVFSAQPRIGQPPNVKNETGNDEEQERKE